MSVPRKVVETKPGRALLNDGRWVNLTLVGKVRKGEWLLAQANMAVEKIPRNVANNMMELLQEENVR